MFKAIKIDAAARSVSCIEVDTLESKQAAVGGLLAGAGYLDNDDFVMVDDEGLLKDPKDFVIFKGFHQPFAGNALIVGEADDDDNDTDCKSTVEEISKQIDFLDIHEMRLLADLGLI